MIDRAVSCYFVTLCFLLASLVKKFAHNSFEYSQVNLPRGSAYVEFKARADAEKAQLFMDGVCIFSDMKYYVFTHKIG